jgi:acetyltransferase EpsM
VLTTQVEIGSHVVIGAGAIVSHDCRVESFATLAPGSLLAGNVTVESGAELGVGATVLPGRNIGRGALVGAKSAVVQDIAPNVVAAGVPARPMRTFEAHERI